MLKGKFLSKMNHDECCGVVYEGYYDPSVTWNGQKVPYLSLGATLSFLDYLCSAYGEGFEHRIDNQNCGLITLYDGDELFETYYPVQLNTGDEVLTLYPLWGHIWTLYHKADCLQDLI